MKKDRSLNETAVNPELVPGQLALPADWEKEFGRAGPLEVEIGSGSGRYVIGLARSHPERDFVAIEPAAEYFYLMKTRIIKRGLTNIRIFRTDAVDLIASCFPDCCVDTYHIYFPDPWPKERHHKRRVIQPEFCRALNRTIKADGTLYLATDHQGYFGDLLPVLREQMDVAMHPGPWDDAPLGRTNFEIKYIKQGRPIWRLSARKSLSKFH